jgi:hypothetical protein
MFFLLLGFYNLSSVSYGTDGRADGHRHSLPFSLISLPFFRVNCLAEKQQGEAVHLLRKKEERLWNLILHRSLTTDLPPPTTTTDARDRGEGREDGRNHLF